MSEGTHGAGKGDTYRQLDMEKYRKNYDAIFGKKNCPSQKARSTKNCPSGKDRSKAKKS